MSKRTRQRIPKDWQSSARLKPEEQRYTRQFLRYRAFASIWAMMSGERALRDDSGIIPRRIRRDIARARLTHDWQNRNKA